MPESKRFTHFLFGYINGLGHAFLLTPNAVPEPSALALFSVGAVVMGMGLRRRK